MSKQNVHLSVKEAIELTRKLGELSERAKAAEEAQNGVKALMSSLIKKYAPEGMEYKGYDADEGMFMFETVAPKEESNEGESTEE